MSAVELFAAISAEKYIKYYIVFYCIIYIYYKRIEMFYENRARSEKIALSLEGRDFIAPKLCPRITLITSSMFVKFYVEACVIHNPDFYIWDRLFESKIKDL